MPLGGSEQIMAEMQILKVDFSDIPDALSAQPTGLFVDFSDIPDAVPRGEPEQTPQVAENPLSGKNILKVDFSDIPDALPVQQKTLHVDFSDIPDREPDATGLVYHPVEYYDPPSGGAINRDPLGFTDWLKSYLYSADNPVRFADATGPALVDPGTAAANADISNLGSGLNSQADLGDQGMPMPGGSAANIYKQWLIGAIDFFSELGWNAPRPDLAGDVSFTSLTGLPWRSPFAAPKDAADITARFMGASQIAALAGLAFEGAELGSAGAGLKSAYQLGLEGEAAVRAVYDIGPKISIKVGYRRLTPDGLIPGVSLSEVKNSGYQGFTTQLRGYGTYVQQESVRFNLYVRGPNAPEGMTRLSGPLQEEIRKARINLIFIPGTE
jgi:RHS repeat-associated protein